MKIRPNTDDYQIARRWADLWTKAHPTQARHLTTLIDKLDWLRERHSEALILIAAAQAVQSQSPDPLISTRQLVRTLTEGAREMPQSTHPTESDFRAWFDSLNDDGGAS